MNNRDEAAWELHLFLTARGIPYVLIGGMAAQQWAEPRFTLDVDMSVAPPLNASEEFLHDLLAHFPPRIDDALAFAMKSRVVLIKALNGCPVDISLALPGYEDEVMRRAVDYEIEPGKVTRLCSAEDFIIYKVVAGRPRDLLDIEGAIARQRRSLDIAYIRRWLTEFAAILENPELLQRFEQPWRRIRTVTA